LIDCATRKRWTTGESFKHQQHLGHGDTARGDATRKTRVVFVVVVVCGETRARVCISCAVSDGVRVHAARGGARGTSASVSTAEFTILLNTFKRRDALKAAIQHYGSCRGVREIVVVWSEQTPTPKEGESGYYVKRKPGFVRYEAHVGSTSIQNRFEPVVGLKTKAVFNVDDDVRIPCGTLSSGYRLWKKHQDALVGYYARNYAPASVPADGCSWKYVANEFYLWWSGRYSIVLTKAAFMHQKYLTLYKENLPDGVREYVDKGKNGEDIAMQFLVSSITGEAPKYAPASFLYYTLAKLGGVGKSGISSSADHHIKRGDAISAFQRMFGRFPLVETYL
jgi:glucuronyl/N-acetylglucosaminyl transferase EXT2